MATAPHAPSAQSTAADRVAQVALLPVQVARRVLPDREMPVYLAAGALAVAGAVEWPVAVGAGLAYAAIKRWSRSSTMAG